MNKTKIEWVRSPDGVPGYTWNPITGCLRGCGYCYARTLAETRLKDVYTSQLGKKRGFPIPLYPPPDVPYPAPAFDDKHAFWPRYWPAMLGDFRRSYYHEKNPRGVFVCDMGELFGPWVPDDITNDILKVMGEFPHFRFYTLTKEPQRLRRFVFPDNVWVGASADSETQYCRAVLGLRDVRAKVKFISFEPLLRPIYSLHEPGWRFNDIGVTWVIVGARNHPYEPAPEGAVEAIMKAADSYGAKVFLKANLNGVVKDYRQDMPKE